ncbi:MAG: cytochrome c oxidase subunit II, partial [Acidimicrobiales bacterium]
ISQDIHNLVVPVFITAGVVMVLVLGAILVFIVRNRVTEYSDDDWPEQLHGRTGLEILWTIVPAVIMAGIAVGTIATLIRINDTEANAIEVSVDGARVSWEPTVVVVGQQWWWEYRYYFNDQVDLAELRANADPRDLPPADIVTSGQMVIPVGQEVELLVTSRDVIHSHWIPALNGKRDAVPGRFSPWSIEADDPGVYFGQCTEFCGLSHSRMRMQVVAVEAADFQAWVESTTADAQAPSAAAADYLDALRSGGDAEAPSATAAERGLSTFLAQCSRCHLVEGVNDHDYRVDPTLVSGAAPNLTHFASRTTFAGGILNTYNPDGTLNREDIEAWIRDPAALKDNAAADGRGMPTLGLSEAQIDDLVAFLESLGPKPAGWIIEATEVE